MILHDSPVPHRSCPNSAGGGSSSTGCLASTQGSPWSPRMMPFMRPGDWRFGPPAVREECGIPTPDGRRSQRDASDPIKTPTGRSTLQHFSVFFTFVPNQSGLAAWHHLLLFLVRASRSEDTVRGVLGGVHLAEGVSQNQRIRGFRWCSTVQQTMTPTPGHVSSARPGPFLIARPDLHRCFHRRVVRQRTRGVGRGWDRREGWERSTD